MSKSKVQSVNFSRSWARDENTTIYYFDIKFEDGTSGQFGTVKREQDKFPLGQEIEYVIKGQNKRGDNVIDKVKPRPENKSSYNDPTTNRKIAMNVALSAAVKAATAFEMKNLTENDLAAIADYFYNWISSEDSHRDVMSLRWNLILTAVDAAHILNITSSKGIVETAEELWKAVENAKPLS